MDLTEQKQKILRKGLICGSVQSLSHVRLFVTERTAAHQASLSITSSQSLLKLMSVESMMPSNHLILCHPFLLPSVFPSIRVFSNESALRIRWPKYWSSILNYSSTRRQNIGFILAPSPNPHCPGQKKITLAALVNVWNVFWCVKISCTVHLSMYIFISVSKITQIN